MKHTLEKRLDILYQITFIESQHVSEETDFGDILGVMTGILAALRKEKFKCFAPVGVENNGLEPVGASTPPHQVPFLKGLVLGSYFYGLIALVRTKICSSDSSSTVRNESQMPVTF